eukprot:943458-Rhodomonas_salina.2
MDLQGVATYRYTIFLRDVRYCHTCSTPRYLGCTDIAFRHFSPTRNPVLRWCTVLRYLPMRCAGKMLCVVLSYTTVGAMVCCYVASGTEMAYAAMDQVMSGTDLA